MPDRGSTLPMPVSVGDLAGHTAARNAWLELDLEALAHNLGVFRGQLNPGVEVIAVVKANAYGHGAVGIARELERIGVDRLAVAWVHEGAALRRAGIRVPIVVLGHAFPEDAATAVAEDLALTCHSRALGEELSRQAQATGTTARVHVKVDTGLHRFGVELDEAVELAEYLRLLPGVEVEGLSTHMANADEPDDSFSQLQAEVFEAAIRRLPWVPFRHVANSATTIRQPALRHQGVRLGLSLYGLLPDNTPDPDLRPVMSLRARVARVAAVRDGEGVGYGLAWKAVGDRKVALVPVGYADGWQRALSGRIAVLIRGVRAPVAGRIAMDQFLVDVSHVADVTAGDIVTLIGRDGDQSVSATDVAAAAGTISWEILAGMQDRLPRLFHRGGSVESVFYAYE